MTIFTGTVFENAKTADANGVIESFISPLADAGLFASIDAGVEEFHKAVASEKVALLNQERADAHKEADELLAGFSWPKSVQATMVRIRDVVEVADADGKVNPWSIVLTFDEEGGFQAKLAGGFIRSASPRRSSSGGKAKLDGQPLTAKLLKDSYPDSVAGRIMANECSPHGIVKKNNGDDYSPKSRMNATQAVKADPVLRDRLSFED